MPALPASPRAHPVPRRKGALRFLKQPRLDLLPRDDTGWVLHMPSNAVIELRPLRIRQRYRVRFQAFPDRVQQFCLLRNGEAIYLASQIAHIPINPSFVSPLVQPEVVANRGGTAASQKERGGELRSLICA